MSDPKDPFDRQEKTVLRLNPGGRRAPAPNPAPNPSSPAQPYNPPPPAQSYNPPPAQSYQPYAAPASTTPYSNPAPIPQQPRTSDEWFSAPPPPQPQGLDTAGRKALVMKRDVPIAPNENLLLEAAAPLLLLLGRLRTSLMHANFANLMEQVADSIEEFEKRARAASIPQVQSDTAKYAICATCDDIVQHIPSEERHIWAQYSMLSRFFGERVGGVRFFEKLDQAKLDANTNYHVLELMYGCLAIGFMGVYRTSQNGPANLQMITRNLYELLRKVRPTTKDDLSPHWRGQDMPTLGSTFRIPFWVLATLASALLFTAFVTLRMYLSGNAEAVTNEMGRMFADTPLTIERAPVPGPAEPAAPPPPQKASTQLERIRGRIADEIASKKMDAVENGNSIIIRVGDFALFNSGQATVLDSFKPLAGKIAEALNAEPGDIRIVGHTDNVRITSTRFASNFELSVERANAVAALIKPKLNDATRIKVEGKGEASPIATNDTAEGRARNRRVEISIPREETVVKK